jgi:hypothetical protein
MKHSSQKEIFGEALNLLNRDITKADREAAMEKLGIKSAATISSYLNGKVRDNDTAAALISFFKKRIEQRNQVLA